MVLLLSKLIDVFRVGIRKRIFVEGEANLLPVAGYLGSIGRTSFPYIYVDNVDPEKVTAILIRSCTGIKRHFDDVLSKSSKEIFDTWMETMDNEDGVTECNDVFVWCDASIKGNLKFLAKGITFNTDMHVLSSTAEALRSIQELHTTSSFEHYAKTYIAYKADNKPIPYTCPDGYFLKSLSQMEAEKALSTWKFKSEGSGSNCLLLSAMNGLAVGAFHRQIRELVSWIFGEQDGAMSALATVEEHQRKGLAKAVIGKMCEIYEQNGLAPFVYIEAVEGYSDSLFQKLGFVFKRDEFLYWGNLRWEK